MAELVLGPMLRYVDARSATVWVETDAPCEVQVLGRTARTFHVAGHHYALVALEGLQAGDEYEYTIELDGERRWPTQDADGSLPASRIRTVDPETRIEIAFGSCRVAAPHEAPWVLERHRHPLGAGVDALQALARRMQAMPSERWPSLLLMVGDQVYADHASPETRAFIRSRRSPDEPPGEEVADFEEYTRLYRESWSEPTIRWLLSTIPSAMIFDDHEVIDDWNTSAEWREEMRRQPWWLERITGAFMTYWLYQHLGNLSPEELRADRLYQQACAAEDPTPLLREFALACECTTDGSRWSYSRNLGRTRLVVVDSRAGRVLGQAHSGDRGPGRREMLDEEEWRWLDRRLQGDVDHLLVVTSLPFLLPAAIHDLEGWDEALAAGRWGATAAKFGEWLRRAVDLEHWAAFRASFHRLATQLHEVAAGRRGAPPASILLLSGDVHYAYVAEAAFPGQASATRVLQLVCSPLRHPLEPKLKLANRLAFSRAAQGLGTLLARSVRLAASPISWRITHGPYFDNEVATVELQGTSAWMRLERTPPQRMELECVLEKKLI